MVLPYPRTSMSQRVSRRTLGRPPHRPSSPVSSLLGVTGLPIRRQHAPHTIIVHCSDAGDLVFQIVPKCSEPTGQLPARSLVNVEPLRQFTPAIEVPGTV